MYYYLLQLGCQMNIADGERIRTVLSEIGFKRTDNEHEAQVLGIVACSVRQKAIDKVYSKIHQWNSWKQTKQIITFASGCILPADKKKFLKQFDLVFAIQELAQLPDFVSQYGVPLPQSYQIPTIIATRDNHNSNSSSPSVQRESSDGENERSARATVAGRRQVAAEYLSVVPQYGSRFEAYVPIQNGCDKFCTFCAVPYTRGREVSRSSVEVIAEVEQLVAAGYKTITLLGQNVNSYGLDTHGKEPLFSELLERIALLIEARNAKCWVYFTSPHPRDFSEEVFAVMARHQSIAKQVHLPLQSGDDKVLMRMNRKHSTAHYRQLVELIRHQLPTATLFTDIIVGFCGESDAQFENTRQSMCEFRYNMAYIAQYSPRPGAASARWPDDISAEVKRHRYRELTYELHRTAFAHNSAMIGKQIEVLVIAPGRKDGFLSARTEGRISTRFRSDDHSLIGQIVPLEITAANGLSLEGVFCANGSVGIEDKKEIQQHQAV